MSATANPQRLFFVDNLRLLLTFLVIFHHASITYGASGWWYFIDAPPSILLSVLTAINQAFFMGLFFLLSGYFTPRSYDRKGPQVYLKDRFIRLGIPLAIYIMVIEPILVYPLIIKPQYGISFFEFYLRMFQSWDELVRRLGGTGPLWFIQTLLIYAVGYTLWRQFATKGSGTDPAEFDAPSNRQLLLLIPVLGVLTFAVRLVYPVGAMVLGMQLGNYVQYTAMFIFGTIAYRRGWFRKISYSQGKQWFAIVVAAIPSLLVFALLSGAVEDLSVLQGGLNYQALVYAIWEFVICIGMIVWLLTLFRRRFNQQGNFARTLSVNAYSVFLIHGPVLVIVAVFFAGISLLPLVKFALVVPLVAALSWLISHYFLRRIPGAKMVLG